MNTIVVDTNVFLRYLLKDIPSQYVQTERLFKQAKENKLKLFIPQIVIFEITFSLEKYYHFPKQEIIDKLKSLASVSYFKIQNKEVFRRALKVFEKENMSFPDCFIFSYAQEKEAELFTFDKAFWKLSKNMRSL